MIDMRFCIPLFLVLVFLAVPATAQLQTGFEKLTPGEFQELGTKLGKLSVVEGTATIHTAHVRTGSNSLRLTGGKRTVVELELARRGMEVGEIRFWAERWTSKGPFEFQVEVRRNGRWKQVYDGSKEIRVGARFLSDVRIPVDGMVDAIRFSCTSPANAGAMIDDLRMEVAGPVALGAVECVQPVLPVLVGNPWNPVARVDISTSGNRGKLDLASVTVDFLGTTDLSVIDKVAIFRGPEALAHADPRGVLAESEMFGKPFRLDGESCVIKGDMDLPAGTTHFWVAVSLASKVDIDQRIRALCSQVVIDRQAVAVKVPDRPISQRLGVALRSRGDDGIDAYRIPGLATTNQGTLIAVYDLRRNGWRDLPADIDVGMSRSTDGGRTWEAMRIVLDQGGEDKANWNGDGVGDPAVLVDQTTNAIYVIGTWSHGNRSWRGSGPGFTPEETGQLMVVRSLDDGVTWEEPQNLTRQLKRSEWSFLLQGPGRGITMHDGTIVFPAQYQESPAKGRTPHSCVIYSKDQGKTWKIGTGAKSNTTESAVVELQDGVLMLNMRDNRGGSRAIHTSSDMGATWEEHPTTRKSLIEPVCMASLIHVGRELNGKADGRLVFSNPHVNTGPRRRMSLQASTDFGASWGPALLLDEGSSAGYSCLSMVDAKTVGIVYEGSRAHMTFQRVPLAELFPEAGTEGR